MKKHEKNCGKCWRLNRIFGICERYNVQLLRVVAGRFPVFAKCVDCLEETAESKARRLGR